MTSATQEITAGKNEIQDGKLSEASARFETLLKTEPDNSEAIHGLAIIAAQTNDLENALELACQAHHLDEANIEFANTYNLLRFNAGDTLDALRSLAAISNKNPGDRESHVNVAQMAAGIGQIEVAYHSLEQYLYSGEADEQVFTMLGNLFDNVLADQPPPKIPE